MKHQRLLLSVVSSALLLCLASACSSTQSSLGDQEWLKPSPRLRSQIEDAARRLPWTHGMERVEMITWFATVGEPAYPTLLAMVQDPRKDVAGSALAALGATRDSRLVEPLRAVPLPKGEEDFDLRLERARALLRLGDWQVVPTLIEGLRDERELTRALSAQTLWESTHEKFGYDANADEAERNKSIALWEAWWHDRSQDPLRPGTDAGNASAPRANTPARADG
jgi:hypothetical protein